MTNRLFVTVLAATLALGLVGCEEQGPAERAGERVDDAMENARDRAEEMGEDAEDALEDAKRKFDSAVDDAEDELDE